MIYIGNASWAVSFAEAYLKSSGGEVYWQINVFAGAPQLVNDELDFEPFFYADYFGPLSSGGVKNFDCFDGLIIANADGYTYKDGVSGFGCLVGSHVRTSENHFSFGSVCGLVVDMRWTGNAFITHGEHEGALPFVVDCDVKYTGLRAREIAENEARAQLRIIDPSRDYRCESQAKGIFKMIPAEQSL